MPRPYHAASKLVPASTKKTSSKRLLRLITTATSFLGLGITAPLSLADNYHLYSSGSGIQWSTTAPNWSINGSGPATPWVNTLSTDPAHSAVFSNNAINGLILQESIRLSSILQSGTSTETTINSANSSNEITLAGSNIVIDNQSLGLLFLTSGYTLRLSPPTQTAPMRVSTTNGDIRINSNIVGSTGQTNALSISGGFIKSGSGTLFLGGNNTYSGWTRLEEGTVEANSSTAFGTSKILFQGGTLRYGAGNTADYSAQFHDGSANTPNSTFRIDTNGNNVVFNTALAGTSSGLIKMGAGTLTMPANNTFTGTVVVMEGVLKGPAVGGYAFGGVNGTAIEVHNGATIDLNGNSTSNYATIKYNLTIEGKGYENSAYAGGYQGALTNTGAGISGNVNPFSNITLTGDTTISGNRWDLRNINANYHTITKTGGDIAWASGTKTNIGDIIIEQGMLFADNGDFGNSNYTIFVNASANPTNPSSPFVGNLQSYNNQTISKKIQVNGGGVRASGDATSITTFTFTTSSPFHLVNNPVKDNLFLSVNHYKDLTIQGVISGDAGFTYEGVNATSGSNPLRQSVLSILNPNNTFTGTVKLFRGVLRLSNGTLNGSLGNSTNTVQFTTGASSGATGSSTDFTTILDLYGTNQSIGALVGSQSNHFVQNNRANSTSTLTVGNGNVSGSFAGILRNYTALYAGNTPLGTEGAGGVLALTKTGSGTQILSGANTYSGNTVVNAGTLLIKNTTGSGTGTGNFSTTGTGRVGGTGSITGGPTRNISIAAGTFLHVGNSHNGVTYDSAAGVDTTAKTFTLGSANDVDIELYGTLQFDLFGKGDLAAGRSDALLLLTNGGDLTLGGQVSVGLASSTVNTSSWAVGDKWKIIDWSGKTGGGSLTETLTLASNNIGGFIMSSYSLGDAYYVEIIAVPEPSRMLISFLAAATILLGYRRRA